MTEQFKSQSKIQSNNVETPKKLSKYAVKKCDHTLLFIVLLLVLFGIVMVFSSSYYYAMTSPKFDDMYYFLKRQVTWSTIGFTMMLILTRFDYRKYQQLAPFFYVTSIILLLLVFAFGTVANGSRRSLDIGGLSFQPSEVAKITLILFLPLFMRVKNNRPDTFKGFLKCLIVIAIPFLLTALQNLSTAVIIAGIGVAMLFVATPYIRYFVPFAGIAALGVSALVLLPQFAYRLNRITAWLDPFADPTDLGFQTVQSLFAIASGGFFGLGIGQSRQKAYIPEPYNDFIFAIICEELGAFGAFIVIGLFLAFIYRGIKIALNAKDSYGAYVATGVVSMIAIQAILNIAVTTNTIPNTGVILPFISYGGSSMFFTMSAVGILLNVSRHQKDKN